jgi:hypothetical protein
MITFPEKKENSEKWVPSLTQRDLYKKIFFIVKPFFHALASTFPKSCEKAYFLFNFFIQLEWSINSAEFHAEFKSFEKFPKSSTKKGMSQ